MPVEVEFYDRNFAVPYLNLIGKHCNAKNIVHLFTL
jgi:hypothetical protein